MRANRSSQLRGNSSARPPNCSTNLRESLRDVHAISICKRLRSDLEMIASLPSELACKMFSCASSQRGSTSLRHRYTAPRKCGTSLRFFEATIGFLFFLGRFFAFHLRYFLPQTGGEFLVLNIIDRESAEHVVRVVPGPIL